MCASAFLVYLLHFSLFLKSNSKNEDYHYLQHPWYKVVSQYAEWIYVINRFLGMEINNCVKVFNLVSVIKT